MRKLTWYEKKYIRKQIQDGDMPSITALKQEIRTTKLRNCRRRQLSKITF